MAKSPMKAYLVLYNAASAVAWSWILVTTIIHLFNLDGKSDVFPNPDPYSASLRNSLPPAFQPIYARASTTFSRVGLQTAIIQSFAAFEVLHALLGWVRSPVPTAAMQVASRLFLVWGVAEQFPQVRSNPLYTSMVLAWSATEAIRYTFYALNLLGLNPYVLLWLRYTTFFILYPIGASSEAFLNYATLPKSPLIPGWKSLFTGIWTSADYVRGALFLIWWPGLYVMYTYMISQRRKVLNPSSKPKKTVKVN
ncbi:PTPLA-domain-containing protein [Panaeolus papilionaceus]|nr:PTPLA-domain-containing protein [Panaeolus papilionaceus]